MIPASKVEVDVHVPFVYHQTIHSHRLNRLCEEIGQAAWNGRRVIYISDLTIAEQQYLRLYGYKVCQLDNSDVYLYPYHTFKVEF
jgi:hypothetical protein